MNINKKLILNKSSINTDNMNSINNIDYYNDLLSLLNKILETHSYNFIAKELNVAIGTVKRWSELQNVPKSYAFDLFKIANIEIDYSRFTYKDKDQFYTPENTAKMCYNKFQQVLKDIGDEDTNYMYIEPSAGNGNFMKVLPSNKRIGMDIEPMDDEILKGDYLQWMPSTSLTHKYVVIGNPPFGLRGQLALKFINHSSAFADYVCFILPQLFESDGKGVPRKRVKGFHLIHSEKLNSGFTNPNGDPVKVECIFQIWSKYHSNPMYDIKEIDDSVVKIYSLSDGGTSSTTRNKSMFDKCDIYIPSTCFGKDNMKYYTSFNDLPSRKGYGIVFKKNKSINVKKFKQIDWSSVAFLSTNSAYNIRTSQIIEQII